MYVSGLFDIKRTTKNARARVFSKVDRTCFTLSVPFFSSFEELERSCTEVPPRAPGIFVGSFPQATHWDLVGGVLALEPRMLSAVGCGSKTCTKITPWEMEGLKPA